jgi:hypothetical protein
MNIEIDQSDLISCCCSTMQYVTDADLIDASHPASCATGRKSIITYREIIPITEAYLWRMTIDG